MFSSDDVRRSYIDFFTDRGHVEIPGASLVPEGDSGVLFTIAGIQPLVPYFGGVPHPAGRRLVNVQRCLRTVDIDEVGDDSHLTCFEMLGNWSLGDYYKHESLGWTLEWLLSIGLPFERLGVTVFEEDPYALAIWRKLGVAASGCGCSGARRTGGVRPGRTAPAGRTRSSSTSATTASGSSSATTCSSPTSSSRTGRCARCRSTTSTSASGWSASPACCRA